MIKWQCATKSTEQLKCNYCWQQPNIRHCPSYIAKHSAKMCSERKIVAMNGRPAHTHQHKQDDDADNDEKKRCTHERIISARTQCIYTHIANHVSVSCNVINERAVHPCIQNHRYTMCIGQWTS